MKNIYKSIVKIIKRDGCNSTLENRKIKALDLKTDILIYEPLTGWLALRKELKTMLLSHEKRTIYFNKVLYKNKNTPYCLKPELKKLLTEIENDDSAL